jgi:LPXTG-motif cell wall-anchored protein
MPQSDQSATQSSQSSNAAQSSTSTTTSDQNTSTSANPSTSTSTTSDQDATAGNKANGGKLPQTATPLPLLALLGMGSLTGGMFARRKK